MIGADGRLAGMTVDNLSLSARGDVDITVETGGWRATVPVELGNVNPVSLIGAAERVFGFAVNWGDIMSGRGVIESIQFEYGLDTATLHIVGTGPLSTLKRS